jgi:hypothetical protein
MVLPTSSFGVRRQDWPRIADVGDVIDNNRFAQGALPERKRERKRLTNGACYR